MLILDITNLKSVDVHLVFFSTKKRNKLQPSPAIRNQRKISRHNLRAQGSCTFQVCQPQIYEQNPQVDRVSAIHSFNSWWFYIFLNSYFFSLLNRWVGGASKKNSRRLEIEGGNWKLLVRKRSEERWLGIRIVFPVRVGGDLHVAKLIFVAFLQAHGTPRVIWEPK